MIEFDWDPPKAESNLKDHHISFKEAKTVFDDSFNVEFYDPDHPKTNTGSLLLAIQVQVICYLFHLPNGMI